MPNIKKINIKKRWWDYFIDVLAGLSEAANIGIVIDMISKVAPAILLVASGAFASLIVIADPLIYIFKSLIRLTRITLRAGLGITLEDEKHGHHPWQTTADIVALVLFGIAILMFCGLIISSPVGITVAWCLALTGLGVIGYFDYSYQEKRAKYNLDTASPAQYEEALKEYLYKKNSNRLFIMLLIGLSFLLIVGSAVVFAPPLLAAVFLIAAKVASALLVVVAILRVRNWYLYSSTPNNSCEIELIPMNSLILDRTPEPSVVEGPENSHRYSPLPQTPGAAVLADSMAGSTLAVLSPNMAVKMASEGIGMNDATEVTQGLRYGK